MKVFYLFVGLVFSVSVLHAQKHDHSALEHDHDHGEEHFDSSRVAYFLLEDYLAYDYRFIDTALVNVQRFDPAKKDGLYITRGNLGLTHRSLEFNAPAYHRDRFGVGEEAFPSYYFNWRLTPLYLAETPTSEITYTSASNEEQLLYLTLANQVSKTVYIGLDAQFQRGLGDYINQDISSNQFRLTTSYTTLDKRYHAMFNFTRNKFRIGENGGIVDDKYYEDTVRFNRKLIPVNLEAAYNEVKTHAFYFHQALSLGKAKDSSTHYPMGQVFLDFIYANKYRQYYDEDVLFYTNRFIDTLSTEDSVYSKQMAFRLGWQNGANRMEGLQLRLFGEYQMNAYYNNLYQSRYDYFVPQASLSYNGEEGLSVKAMAQYSMLLKYDSLSYGDQNYDLNFAARQKFLKDAFVFADMRLAKRAPDYYLVNTYSNHYIWKDTDFKDEQITAISAVLGYKDLSLSATLSDVANYTGLYDSIGVRQSETNLQHLSVKLESDFRWDHFGFSTLLLYQHVNDVELYAVPELAGRVSVFTNFHLFKRAMKLEPGVEVYALSSYYAPYYDPSLASFTQQADKKVDEQLYVDFFVNMKIKRARVFLKYQHLNSLFMDYNYFLTAHYPMQDAGLKVGISWKFYK